MKTLLRRSTGNLSTKILKSKMNKCYFKLHVFGSNTGARKLYEELGFEVAGINMLKTLEEKLLS